MNAQRKPIIAMPIVLLISICSPAAFPDGGLMVLGRDSAARPAESLVGDLLSRFDEPEDASVRSPITPEQKNNLADGGGLPIGSKLVPSEGGEVVHHIDIPMAAPLCIVGPDRVSRSWLARNRAWLHELGASCVLVKAESRNELDWLRRIARPVPLHPLPFDEIAARYGIRTVPAVLVGNKHP